MLLQGILAGCEVFVDRQEEKTRFEEHEMKFEEKVDGKEEYSPPTSRCYLECEEDKEFRIVFKRGQSRQYWTDLAAKIFLDGNRAISPVIRTGVNEKIWDSMVVKGPSGFVEANLKFRKIELMEHNDRTSLKAFEQIGTIRIDFFEGRAETFTKVEDPRHIGTPVGAISEKIKKGFIAQTVGIGQSRPFTGYKRYKFDYKDRTKPCYRVILTYRSRALLIARDIIPRPAPQPQEEQGEDDEVLPGDSGKRKRQEHSSTIEEDDTSQAGLLAKVRRMELELAALRDIKKIKTEHQPVPTRIPAGTIVDLTLDDDDD